MKQHKHSLAAIAAGLATLTVALAAGPAASAQTDKKTEQQKRQEDKNNMRNLGTGLGAAAVLQALSGKGTNALILGAGAAYTYKKYDDAKKAQAKEELERQNRENRRYGSQRSGFGTAGSSSKHMPVSAAAPPIGVYVDDEQVNFSDQKPEMTAGNVYVPMRGVLEKIGATVKWDAQDRAVVAMQGDKTVKLPLNGMAVVNGSEQTLETPAYIENGRTMVPLRFLAETFGAQVFWDAKDRDVHINTSGMGSAG